MGSRITLAVIGAVAYLLCQVAPVPGIAKVVRDSSAAASNPAVEAGGHRLTPQPPPPIPYSFLGAMESQGSWFMQCALWPWRQFGNWGWYRHREIRDANRIDEIPRFERRFQDGPRFDRRR
jgi:hypothetical protein